MGDENLNAIPQWRLDIARKHLVAKIYSVVISLFNQQEHAGQITVEALAGRLDWTVEHAIHILGHPEEWKLRTISDLCFAMGGAEINWRLVPYPSAPTKGE